MQVAHHTTTCKPPHEKFLNTHEEASLQHPLYCIDHHTTHCATQKPNDYHLITVSPQTVCSENTQINPPTAS